MNKATSTQDRALAKVKVSQATNGQVQQQKVSVPPTMANLKSNKVADIIQLYTEQLARVLPKHLTADRMMQVYTTMITRTPQLAQCSTTSLINCLVTAGMVGLDPTPQLGLCAIIPRRNSKTGGWEAEFQFMYKGLVRLAWNSGQIKSIHAYVVREGDGFNYQLGLDPDLSHVPSKGERGKMTHAYAVLKFKDGGTQFIVLTRDEVMKYKALSTAANTKFSPWNAGKTNDPNSEGTHEEAMWLKTALLRVFRYAPLSIEDTNTLALEGKVIPKDAISLKDQEIDYTQLDNKQEQKIETEYEVIDGEPVDKETGEVIESVTETPKGDPVEENRIEMCKRIDADPSAKLKDGSLRYVLNGDGSLTDLASANNKGHCETWYWDDKAKKTNVLRIPIQRR